MKKFIFNTFKKSRKTFAGYGLGKYTVVQKTSNWLAKKLHPDYIIHNGNKFFLDENDSIHYSLGETIQLPEHISKIITNACAEGNTIVDVGANIGWHTLEYARLVGSSGKVFAFEPVVENFNLLQKNIHTNNYQNISCTQKAISNQIKQVTIELSTRIGDHRIIEEKSSDRPTIKVDAITLDSFFKNENKIDFLKIDAEGYDFFVLQGAEQIIQKNPQLVIFIEFNPYLLNLNNVEPKKLVEFLINLGFTLYDVENSNNVEPSTLSDILMYDDGDKTHLTNLLCVKC